MIDYNKTDIIFVRVQAIITRYHRLGGLNNINLFLTVRRLINPRLVLQGFGENVFLV